jgi:hypothetical protein
MTYGRTDTAIEPWEMKAHHLYRHFDADDRLLLRRHFPVGIASAREGIATTRSGTIKSES